MQETLVDSWVGKFPWRRNRLPTPVFLGFPGGSEGKASACNAGDRGSIPELGRSPGEGNGNPLQYSCLENPMDGGAWEAAVHEVAKSFLGFPSGSDGKESACNLGDLGSIPGSERSPGGGHGNPLQYSCPENCHGLVGYSPWSHKESDTTESLSHTEHSAPPGWPLSVGSNLLHKPPPSREQHLAPPFLQDPVMRVYSPWDNCCL